MQIPINRNVLSLIEFNQKVTRLVDSGLAKTDGHHTSRFVYDNQGNVLGGVVWKEVRRWEYGRYVGIEKPYGYLHS